MPSSSFRLILHGPSPAASQELHDAVVRSAIQQEAAPEVVRCEGVQHVFYWNKVTEDFPQAIKEVLNEHDHVGFEAQMAEPWDLEEVWRNHEGPWRGDFETTFSFEDIEVPDGGWRAAQDAYVEWVDWADRIDEWDLLMATA
jgi:hypothetical protein